MVDMKDQASCCTFISASEAEACKIPLLDAEISGSSHITRMEVSLEKAEAFIDICRRDRRLLHGITCTAWALLLRCYIGQDRVTFEYSFGNTTASLLRISFDEDETLSRYTENARDVIAGIEQKRLITSHSSATTLEIKAIPHIVNTGVCICDSDMSAQMLAAKTPKETMKVSYENLKLYDNTFNRSDNSLREISHYKWKSTRIPPGCS